MLVLERKVGEEIELALRANGDFPILLRIIEVTDSRVRIGFVAENDVVIVRKELRKNVPLKEFLAEREKRIVKLEH